MALRSDIYESIYCSTAYQLLNILCIAEVEKTKPDLIIVRRQLLESCDVEYLKNTGLFSNIYEWPDIHELLTSEAVRNKWDLLTYNIRRASCCLYVRNIWKKLPNRQMVYEKVYVGYDGLCSKIIF